MGRLTCLKPRVGAAPVTRVTTPAGPQRENTGSAWRRIRRRILARDCGMCQACLAAGRFTVACDVDHRVPVWEGGTDADANLQSLCDVCHKAKTAAEATRRAAGGGPP
jgi:5-methylcytosine-specific restriction protein A